VMTEFYKVFDAYLQPSQEELIHFASDTDEAIQLVRSIDNKK
jgi:hypothetical protein